MLLSEGATSGGYFFLAPWIVFFPLIGLLINVIFGGRLSEKVVGTIASTASGLSFVVSLLLAISLVSHAEAVTVPLADWITVEPLHLRWAFLVDTLSVTMMLVVSGVGTLIHIYAIGYMHEDVRHNGDPSRFRRFFVFLNLFIAAMMILVGSDNYMMLFVGWEGVGLCSFLLIGFWYEKGKDGIGNSLAAMKAFITNRVGDFGFLIAGMLLFWTFLTFEFHPIFEAAPEVAKTAPMLMNVICLFMLLGVTGKSAQIPLYVWLPDAMAGPTPVSALIHAATMVTAGVYLIARSHALFVLAPQAAFIGALVGGVTGLFAASIAVGQFDIKKVLAYSTISQLGFMVAAVSMGAVVAGMFHLVTHAFFKALLFLSSGSVIQGMERGHHHVEHDAKLKKQAKGHGHELDPQDMRNMGGLRHQMKITFWVYMIGTVALAGIPPLAGFWSKDEILAESSKLGLPVYIILTGAAFLTAFYMTRQVMMVFFGEARSGAAEHAQESPPVMTVPLMILAGLSILGGLMNLPFEGFHNFTKWLEHSIEGVHEGEFVILVASLSTVLALLAIVLAWWIYHRRYPEYLKIPAAKRPVDPLAAYLGPVFTWLNQKWYIDELYGLVIIQPYKALSAFLADRIEWQFWHDWFHDTVLAGGYNLITRLLTEKVDAGVIDASANGLGTAVQGTSSWLRRLQTGFVRNYALAIFMGVVLILGYLILR
jgi:NADH-quinone oxidoreductase subunit L